MRRCSKEGESHRHSRGFWHFISIFLILALPLQVSAEQLSLRGEEEGSLSCNPRISLTAQRSPFFLDDPVHILADIGAASIQGGTRIEIDEFKYALDCAVGQTIKNCVAEGNVVSLDDLNIATNCVDTAGNPVDWQVTEANIRTFSPTSNLPVAVPANSTCRVEFDVTVHELDGADNIVRESLGWTSSDAACDNGLPAAATSSVNIVIQECGIDLVKEVSIDNGATWHDANTPGTAPDLVIGGNASYRLRVENTGTVGFVQPISIVDAALGIDTTIPSLAAGASTIVGGGTIPQLNVSNRCQSAGSLENVSSAQAFCRSGLNPVSATDDDNAWVNCIAPGAIQILKEISIDGGSTWHDANTAGTAPSADYPSGADYRITVSNPGPDNLVNVVVNDATLGVTNYAVGALAAGANAVLTSAQIPALGVAERCDAEGIFPNTATADGDSAASGEPVPQASDPAYLVCVAPPAIDVLKEISVDGGATWHDANSAGTAPVVEFPSGAEYRITVGNPGPTDLVNVVVNDATLGISGYSVGNLPAGASAVLTSGTIASLSVAQVCDSAGTFTNTATADGDSAETGSSAPQASDPANLVCVEGATINILKEISVDGGSTWHDANSAGTAPVVDFPSGAEYRVTVSNPGPTDLVDVVVNDATLGISNYAVGSLAAGASAILTSGDIPALSVAQVCDSAGTYSNTATADGESAKTGAPAPQASDPANLVCVAPPVIEVLKEISVDGGATWHDANSAGTAPVVDYPSGAEYRITVSNPGPTDLVNVVVNDATLGISNYAVGNLSAGASVVLTSGDIAGLSVAEVCDSAGTYTNTAMADGESADTGSSAPQASDPANLVCVAPPVIGVLKEISVDGGTSWYDANSAGTAPVVDYPSGAEYRITVSNPGPTDLVDVVVNDATLGISNYAVGDLAAGASVVLTSGNIAALSVAEVCDSAGTYTNTATADGDSAETGSSAPQASDPANLVCAEDALIQILKEISVDGGATWHDANSAGTAPVVDYPSGALYRITVSNAGSADLVNVVVNDLTLGIAGYSVGSLASGASVVLTSGDIPALDVQEVCNAAGTYTNTATADGDSAETGDPAPQASDPANLVCVDPPEITVLKEISVDGGSTWYDANSAGTAPVVTFPSGAEYRITVHNPGTTDLENVVVNDVELGIAGFAVGNLIAGGTVVLTSGAIPELDVSEVCDGSGAFTNTATADGISAETGAAAPQASDPAVLVCIGTPSIALAKEISVDDGGTWHDANDLNTAVVAVFPSPALYRLTVTNNGTSPLTDVLVNDPDLGIVDYPVGSLDIGESVVLTSGEIPELSVSVRCDHRGTFVNNATASGMSAEDDSEVNDSDPAYLVCVGEPHISIIKEISVDGGATWYDDVPPPQLYPSDAWYRISVTNDGTAPLEDVEVSDLTLGIVDYFVGNLDVGDTVVLTEAEIPELYVEDRCTGGGEFMNTASTVGASTDFPYEDVNDSDMASLECVGDPMVEIDKEISVDGGNTYIDADDMNTAAITVAPADVYYRFIIRNIGPVALTNILVSDPVLGIFDFQVADLPVGGEVTIDSGDLAALFVEDRCTSVGTFLNTASVSAESSDGGSANDSDPAWLSCVGTPDIQIVKEISTNGGLHWFDDMSTAELPPANALYRLRVTNTGTSDLDDVVVSDPTLGVVNYYVGFLGIGQSVLLTYLDIPQLSTTNRCTSPGSYVNTSTTNGVSVDYPYESVNDSDPATLVCIQFQDVCGAGKPKRLRLQYDADSDSNHSQSSSEVVISPPNAVFPASVYIEVFGHRGELLSTHSNVPPGYVFDVEGPQNKIPPRLSFRIYTSQGGTLLQTVQFHSSCSQPLEAGDEFGAITVVAGFH